MSNEEIISSIVTARPNNENCRWYVKRRTFSSLHVHSEFQSDYSRDLISEQTRKCIPLWAFVKMQQASFEFQIGLWKLSFHQTLKLCRVKQRPSWWKSWHIFLDFSVSFQPNSDSHETVPWNYFYGASLIVSLELLERLELLDTRPNTTQHLLNF